MQIGVTVAGFFSAAYGASTIAPTVQVPLVAWGIPHGFAAGIAFVVTTLVIAYLSLILGELAPKRIALQRATGVALLTAPVLDRFASLMRPVIWLLSASTDLVVRTVGGDPGARKEAISHDEIRDLVVEHAALAEGERRILMEVFDAGQRSLLKVMRPRTEVEFLDVDTPLPQARARALAAGHSRFPVSGESLDDIRGVVLLRDLLITDVDTHPTVADLVRVVLQLPASKPALAALADMRRDNTEIAIVVDEYGGTAGIVTLEDIVEEIVGEIGDEYDSLLAADSARDSGRCNVDGLLITEDFETATGISLPDGPYETVAGFVQHRLQHVPHLGDRVTYDGNRFVVSAMDGRRIARIRVSLSQQSEESTQNRFPKD